MPVVPVVTRAAPLRQMWRVLSLALGTMLAGGAASASAASATITEVGWWTRDPAAAAPDGGLAVGNAPDGALTVAAVRIQVPTGRAGTVTLTLVEADSVAPLGAGVRACVTRSPWVAATGGSFDEAPAPACDAGSALLTRADDGSWKGDISALVTSGSSSASVVIVPDDGAPAAFKLSFDPPALSSSGAAEPAPPATSPVTTTTAPPAPASPSPPAGPSTLSLTAPAATAEEPTPAAPSEPADQFAALPSRPSPAGAGQDGGGGKDWAQLVRLALVSLAFGGVLAGSRRALVVLEPRAKVAAIASSLRSRRGPTA